MRGPCMHTDESCQVPGSAPQALCGKAVWRPFRAPGAAQRSRSERHLLRKLYLRLSWMSLKAARERNLHFSQSQRTDIAFRRHAQAGYKQATAGSRHCSPTTAGGTQALRVQALPSLQYARYALWLQDAPG